MIQVHRALLMLDQVEEWLSELDRKYQLISVQQTSVNNYVAFTRLKCRVGSAR